MAASRARFPLLPLAGLLVLQACKAKAPPPAPAPAPAPMSAAALPASPFDGHLRLSPPPGWEREENAFNADYTLRFTRGPETIRVQLLGGEGSIFPAAADYLASLIRGGESAEPPISAGEIQVGARRLPLLRRSFTALAGDLHGGGGRASARSVERVCLLEHGRRFAVFAHTLPAPGNSAPEPGPEWSRFLAAVEILAPY